MILMKSSCDSFYPYNFKFCTIIGIAFYTKFVFTLIKFLKSETILKKQRIRIQMKG